MKLKEFFFTGFYSGYIPVAPGTAGTVVGMLLYMLAGRFAGEWLSGFIPLIGLIAAFYPSTLICGWGELFFGRKDPGPVVWDEIFGYWVTMLFVPYNWKTAFIGFALFRLMDIIKPVPAFQLQRLKGGLGILIDDVIAGIYACLVLHLIIYLLKLANINILQ